MAARRCSCYFGDRLMPLPSPISNHSRAEREWVVTTVTQHISGFDILIQRLWSHLENFLKIDIGDHWIFLPDADSWMRSPNTSSVIWNIPLLCFLISLPVLGKYNNNSHVEKQDSAIATKKTQSGLCKLAKNWRKWQQTFFQKGNTFSQNCHLTIDITSCIELQHFQT